MEDVHIETDCSDKQLDEANDEQSHDSLPNTDQMEQQVTVEREIGACMITNIFYLKNCVRHLN